MGLLDFGDSPQDAGLLSLGLRLMSTPGKFGTALGQAGLGAMGDYRQAQQIQGQRKLREQQAQEQALRQRMLEMQLAQAQQAQEQARAQAQRDDQFRSRIPSPQGQALQALGADASPTVANAARMPAVDPQQQLLYEAVQTRQPGALKDYMTALQPKAPEFKVVGDSLVQIGGGRVSEAYRAPPKPEAAPAAVREYQFAKEQGYPGTFQQFQLEQRRAGASSTRVDVNTGDNKFEAKAGEVLATQFSDTYKQGQAATRALGQVTRLDGLLKKTGGGFTPAIKVYAGQFGVNTAGLDDLQAAEAVIQSLIPQQRPAGSGTMSDKDVDLFRQSLPRLINQPGGNQKIISTMRGLYEYDQKMGQIASDALANKISRNQAMEMMNALPNPLAEFAGGESIHSQADAIIKGAGNGKR